MQPASALVNKRKQNLAAKAKAPTVSVAQSKDIMDDLLGELDGQDDDALQEVYAPGGENVGAKFLQDDEVMAFTKEDELEMKYNIKTNVASAVDKKRTISEVAHQVRSNPFAKDSRSKQEGVQKLSAAKATKLESVGDEQPVE
jgi:hypothetical protein